MSERARVGWALYDRSVGGKWFHEYTAKTKSELVREWGMSYRYNYRQGLIKIVPVYATKPEDME